MWEDVCRLYAVSMPFYKGLEHGMDSEGPDTHEGPGTSPWQLQRLSCICRSNLIDEGFISAHSRGTAHHGRETQQLACARGVRTHSHLVAQEAETGDACVGHPCTAAVAFPRFF